MTGKNRIILGADAGTHGVRILAMQLPDCTVIAQSVSNYSREIVADTQEMDAREFEIALFSALDRLDLPQNSSVAAMGITHQRGTVIPVDSRCYPLGPAICDSDNRALGPSGFKTVGIDPEHYYYRSGCPVVSFNGLTKILWYKKHFPEEWSNVHAWLSPQDYLISRLTGKLQLSEGSVMRSGFLDVHKRTVWKDLLPDASFLDLPCVPVAKSCGMIDSQWINKYSCLSGTELFAVPGDQPSAYIGSGAGKNTVVMNLGTTFVASVASEVPVKDPDCKITNEILPEGLYAPEFGTGAGGQFMEFVANIFDVATDWSVIESEAQTIPSGSDGLQTVPLLWQVTSHNIDGRISGFRPFHTRGHIFRSAYEGLAYEARLSIQKITWQTIDPEDIHVFGGLSDSGIFLQILANVLAIPVKVAVHKQASAFGAGLTSALGLGVFPDLESVTALAGAPDRVYYPQKEEETFYEKEFQRYKYQR